jgi:hypothetical protein
VFKITINSWALREIAKKTPELYQLLRKHDGNIPPVEKAEEGYHDFTAFITASDDIPPELYEHIKFEPIVEMKLMHKGRTDTLGLKAALHMAQVHLPGNELLKIVTTKVLTNCCTEDLDRELGLGWRIVAVCVQPGDRRPDYVMGRFVRE